jgi:hypothetical protein
MPDLWPADLGDFKLMPPVSILREQADWLSKKTKGRLEGKVISGRDSLSFIHRFLVVAPALDNYSYELFHVLHSIDYYPLQISTGPTGYYKECKDEQQFLAAMKEFLANDKTKKVVSAILAQIDEEQPQEEMPA